MTHGITNLFIYLLFVNEAFDNQQMQSLIIFHHNQAIINRVKFVKKVRNEYKLSDYILIPILLTPLSD